MCTYLILINLKLAEALTLLLPCEEGHSPVKRPQTVLISADKRLGNLKPTLQKHGVAKARRKKNQNKIGQERKARNMYVSICGSSSGNNYNRWHTKDFNTKIHTARHMYGQKSGNITHTPRCTSEPFEPLPLLLLLLPLPSLLLKQKLRHS